MLKVCALCGKSKQMGNLVSRKGQLKKKGGTGSKITRSSRRSFFANLQKMRIIIAGHPRKAYICTKCIKKGAFARA